MLVNLSATDTYTVVISESGVTDGAGTLSASAVSSIIDYTLNISIANASGDFSFNSPVILSESAFASDSRIDDLGPSTGVFIDRHEFTIAPNPFLTDDSLPAISILGDFGISDTQDSISFVVKSGDALTFDADLGATLGADIDTRIELRNAAGEVVASNDDSTSTATDFGSVSTLDSYLTYTSTTTEVLSLTIQPLGSMTSGGSYLLNVSLNPTEGLASFENTLTTTILDERQLTTSYGPEEQGIELNAVANGGLSVHTTSGGNLLLFGEALPSVYEAVFQSVTFESFYGDPGDVFVNIDFGALDNSGAPFKITSRDVKLGSTEIQLNNITQGASGDQGAFSTVTHRDGADGSLYNSGDINGDGFDDMILSGDGIATIVFGNSSGSPDLDTGSKYQLSINDLGSARTNIAFHNVTHAGDLNGDGYGDLLGTVSYIETTGSSTTAVTSTFVMYGASDTGLTSLDQGTGTTTDNIIDIDFTSLPGVHGFNVASPVMNAVGDINGDGFDDLIASDDSNHILILGGDGFAFNDIGAKPGVVDIADTSSDIFTLDTSSIGFADNSLLATTFGPTTASILNAAGDINGDGFDDLLMAFGYSQNGAAGAYILFGQNTAALEARTLTGHQLNIEDFFSLSDSLPLLGDAVLDYKVQNAAAVGDVNGDGFDDIAITLESDFSAVKYSSSAQGTYIIFGGLGINDFAHDIRLPEGLYLSDLDNDGGIHGFRLSASDLAGGISAPDYVGANVTNGGDINGDGFDDLLVTPYSISPYAYSSGSPVSQGDPVVIFGGPQLNSTGGELDLSRLTSEQGRILQPAVAQNLSGAPHIDGIEATGDFNGDGFSDLFNFDYQLNLFAISTSGNDLGDGGITTPGTVLIYGSDFGASQNLILGTPFSDQLFSTGGMTIRAGAGDDNIDYNPADILISGGNGVDFLNITATTSIDLSNPAVALEQIEGFSLNNTGSVITLNAGAIVSVADGNAQLASITGKAHNVIIEGGATDQVITTDADWFHSTASGTTTINTTTYDIYTKGNSAILVQQGVTTDISPGLATVDDFSLGPVGSGASITGTIPVVSGGSITEINGTPYTQGTTVTLDNNVQLTIGDVTTGTFTLDTTTAFGELSPGETGHLQFDFTVDDGVHLDFGTATISINGLNDEATIRTDGFTPVYSSGGEVALFDSTLAIHDPDNHSVVQTFVTADNGTLAFRPGTDFSLVAITSLPNGFSIDPSGGATQYAFDNLPALLEQLVYIPNAGNTTSATVTVSITVPGATSTFTQTVDLILASIVDNNTSGGTNWNFASDWTSAAVPTATDDVNLLNALGPITVGSTTSNTATTAVANNLNIRSSTAQVIVGSDTGPADTDTSNRTLSLSGKLALYEGNASGGVYIKAGGVAGGPTYDSVLSATDVYIARNNNITLGSTLSGTAILQASNGILVEGTLMADYTAQLSTTTTVTVDTATLDITHGEILLNSTPSPLSVTNMLVTNTGGTGRVEILVSADTRLEGHQNSVLTLQDATITLQSDASADHFTDSSSTTVFSPAIDLAGDGEIDGAFTFTNNRTDFIFDSDDLLADTTLVNKGIMLITNDSNFFGDVSNFGRMEFINATLSSGGEFINKPGGDLVFGAVGATTTTTSTITQGDGSAIVNQGTITIAEGNTTLSANLTNEGDLYIAPGANLTVNNVNHVLNLAGGHVHVDSTAVLTIVNGEVVIDNDTFFINNGTIDFNPMAGATKVLNGADELLVDTFSDGSALRLSGYFGLGANSLNVLRDPTLGTLNTSLTGVALDFLDEVEITEHSTYNLDIDPIGTSDSLTFDKVTLGGRLSVNPLNTITAGQTFVIVSALAMDDSFRTMLGGELGATTIGDPLLNPVYDYTSGSASVTLEALAVTQAIVSGNASGTTGTDVILAGTTTTSVTVISTDDVVISQSSAITFEADTFDFARLAGQSGGFNTLKLNVDGDFRDLPGTSLENIQTIDLSAAGSQTIELDEMSIRNILDNSGQTLTITNGFQLQSDKVILFGNFEQTFASTQVDYQLKDVGLTVTIDESIFVEIHKDNGEIAFFGSSADDTLVGTDNRDFIDGMIGDDSISGGHGDDIIVFDSSDTGIIDGGAEIDTLLLNNGVINLSGVSNFTNFESIQLDGNFTGVTLTFADLFGTGNFLDSTLIDTYSTDASYGDHQLLISGSDMSALLDFEGIEISGANTSLATELSGAGITQGPDTNIMGQDVVAFTKGDVTIFITREIFDNANYAGNLV
ncbi:MAG: FG-GAP repeat protein [Pseudomonadales bacterium]|nr:FG-GAP repeat protein [Pseudomonadales bacterium]